MQLQSFTKSCRDSQAVPVTLFYFKRLPSIGQGCAFQAKVLVNSLWNVFDQPPTKWL